MINETLNSILSRRSVRNYKPDIIPEEIITAILEASQAAPYVQPDSRHFSVITSGEVITRLGETAKAEGMKISDFHRELFGAPCFDGTYGALVMVVVAGNETSVQYEAVCAASVQNMLVAAQSLDVASCWAYFPIFAFHGAEAGSWRAELRIPKGYKPCAAVLLGYGSENSSSEPAGRYKNSIAYITEGGR